MSKIWFAILFFGVTCYGREPSPDIVVVPQVIDLGKVDKEKEGIGRFEVRNKGEGTLIIDRVRTSCGCTSAEISSKVIKPGGKERLKVAFSSSREGPFKEYIYIESNDPDEPRKRLVIYGDVIGHPSLNISIQRVSWGKKGSILVKNLGELAIRILGIKTPSKDVRTSISSKRIEPGNSATLTIKGEPKEIRLLIEVLISMEEE